MKEKTDQQAHQVLIILGSNINPAHNIPKALHLLRSRVTIRKSSSVYESAAVGSSGPNYLNSAVLIETNSSLDNLRENILSSIEEQLKRVRSSDKYMDRTIDLDVIIFNGFVIDSELWTQAHVALPAAEILPNFADPESGEKISQAAKRLLPGINIQVRSDISS